MDAIISSYSVWESFKTFLTAKFKGCSTVDIDKFIATLIPIYALTTHLRSSETNNSLVHLQIMNSKDQDSELIHTTLQLLDKLKITKPGPQIMVQSRLLLLITS